MIETTALELEIPRDPAIFKFQHSNCMGTRPQWCALVCRKVTWNINEIVPPLGPYRAIQSTPTANFDLFVELMSCSDASCLDQAILVLTTN